MGIYGHSNGRRPPRELHVRRGGSALEDAEDMAEVLSSLYTGSKMGRAIAGDEDNGEQSAW